MAEELILPITKDKKEIYKVIIPQIEAVISDEPDLIANLANITAILKEAFSFFWVGFYLAKDNQLVLGPFQGTLACTRIAFGKGVCGTCYQKKETILVPDVEKFEGHIACSSLSKSEIVVPILKDNEVVMVLDVDSDQLDDFDLIDKEALETLALIISQHCL